MTVFPPPPRMPSSPGEPEATPDAELDDQAVSELEPAPDGAGAPEPAPHEPAEPAEPPRPEAPAPPPYVDPHAVTIEHRTVEQPADRSPFAPPPPADDVDPGRNQPYQWPQPPVHPLLPLAPPAAEAVAGGAPGAPPEAPPSPAPSDPPPTSPDAPPIPPPPPGPPRAGLWPTMPTSPPSVPPQDPPPPAPPGPSVASHAGQGPWRGWRIPAAIVLAALLVVSGFGIARATYPDRQLAANNTTATTTGNQTVGQDQAPPSATDEPVAAAAAALAPSVVQIETSSGLGSGIIYDNDGHVLTAAHVVQGTDRVTIRLADGTALRGEVVGSDDVTDVAVVRVMDAQGNKLPPATLATGVELHVGQMAVAVGSPFGLDQTVTAGIVSAVDRAVPTGNGAIGMIQTDAPINPGNSGGALADRLGRVIGINDAIRSNTDQNAGVGFAIPIDLAKSVADSLVAGTPPQYGFLGVQTAEASGGSGGALVTDVESGSPADKAGLARGDVVVAVDGKPIHSVAELVATIRTAKAGDKVTLTVSRNGKNTDVSVTLGALEAN